jgi:hypothetical protein
MTEIQKLKSAIDYLEAEYTWEWAVQNYVDSEFLFNHFSDEEEYPDDEHKFLEQVPTHELEKSAYQSLRVIQDYAYRVKKK